VLRQQRAVREALHVVLAAHRAVAGSLRDNTRWPDQCCSMATERHACRMSKSQP
jgi:hypothetical protein